MLRHWDDKRKSNPTDDESPVPTTKIEDLVERIRQHGLYLRHLVDNTSANAKRGAPVLCESDELRRFPSSCVEPRNRHCIRYHFAVFSLGVLVQCRLDAKREGGTYFEIISPTQIDNKNGIMCEEFLPVRKGIGVLF